MIIFKSGNILADKSQAIVNTVNCVGVMGKGLALQYKKAFPDNYKKYKAACDKGNVALGKMFVTHSKDILDDKYIINFPTKNHWKGNSKLEYIDEGLDDLVKVISDLNINSIAIPPLGAGLGGLDWGDVKARILDAFEGLENISVYIYEPKGSPKAKDQINNTDRPKMTKGRALLIKLLEFYFHKGYECTKVEVQKLAYFLQESGIDLRLKYVAHNYGPYADNLNHVLQRVDGHYIQGFGDRVVNSEISLVESSIQEADDFLKGDVEARECLSKVEKLIDGYETPLSMEVLATVHWAIKHTDSSECRFDTVKEFVNEWNERKASWKDSYLEKAISRLEYYNWV